MKTNRNAPEITLLKALLVAVVMASVAHAGIAYLPLTGPAPIRMLAMKAPKPAPVTIAHTSATPVGRTNVDWECTNEPVAMVKPAVNTGTNTANHVPYTIPPVSLGAGNPLETTFGGPVTILALPTPDLLGITPQMLATYFHPVDNGTNRDDAAEPLRIGFLPPLAEPEKSSHAEYIVK